MNLIEQVGPNVARAVVGDDYNPDFRYELETTEEGLHLIVTDTKTGEATVKDLVDTNRNSQHFDPVYDADRINALNTYHKRDVLGALLSFITIAAVLASICWVLYHFAS